MGGRRTGDVSARQEVRAAGGGRPGVRRARTRPARGDGTEQLKTDAGNAISGVESLVSIDYDELTGYVRVGFHEPDDIDAVEDALVEARISLDLIILQVVYPIRVL